MKGILLAGTQSGAGKTTASLALMAALARRGLVVQGFKVGPDFIDPGHHRLATGRPSHNLDGWMLPADENRRIFGRYAAKADVAVVEGVMGLYDGFDPSSDNGSSAEMARLLGLDVALLANARAMARSLVALARGFAGFGPGISWAGLIANKAGSKNHVDILAKAMESAPEMPFLGGLAKRPELALPERHLGLVTAEEGGFGPEAMAALADWLEEGIDLDRLLEGLPEAELSPAEDVPEAAPAVRLGVAKDRAFCFYYEENLRRLRAAGAELVFFSPLEDKKLPAGLDGLYLGGGYPELFARDLADNKNLRREIAALCRDGLPVYAECGGMMYLGRELKDTGGRRWPMAGVLPINTGMLPRLRSLGYREAVFTGDNLLGIQGAKARGHEFHYSEITEVDDSLLTNSYEVIGRKGPAPTARAYQKGNVLASYLHLHFGSNPDLAPSLVESCRLAGGRK